MWPKPLAFPARNSDPDSGMQELEQRAVRRSGSCFPKRRYQQPRRRAGAVLMKSVRAENRGTAEAPVSPHAQEMPSGGGTMTSGATPRVRAGELCAGLNGSFPRNHQHHQGGGTLRQGPDEFTGQRQQNAGGRRHPEAAPGKPERESRPAGEIPAPASGDAPPAGGAARRSGGAGRTRGGAS